MCGVNNCLPKQVDLAHRNHFNNYLQKRACFDRPLWDHFLPVASDLKLEDW